jgi:hypothetical protein
MDAAIKAVHLQLAVEIHQLEGEAQPIGRGIGQVVVKVGQAPRGTGDGPIFGAGLSLGGEVKASLIEVFTMAKGRRRISLLNWGYFSSNT